MRTLLISLFLLTNLFAGAQTVCNPSGNLMLYTNYDGGTLTINIDQNIPNLKIGICSYEACYINLTGTFLGNVTEVRYAGYNGSNNTSCGSSIPTTTIVGAPGTATTTIVYAPTATVVNSNGYNSIICGYSCNNTTNQGGCNTVDQIEGYFLGYFSGSTLFAHKVQYGCWAGTQSVSFGGNCCPPPAVYPGVVTGSQTLCAGSIPTAFISVASATVSAGTITYQWQSSTSSSSSGFSNISGANATTYAPGALSQTTYYRRAASTVTNNIAYTNVLTVNATPLPSVTISGSSSLCIGMSTTLSANGGTSYAWSSGIANGNSVVTTPTVSTVITVTCFPASGCSVTASQPIIVDPLPPLLLNAPSSSFLCFGDASYMSITGGAGSYLWEPGSITSNSFTFVATTAIVYTVTVTHNTGCIQTKTVYINPKPLPNIIVPFPTITSCAGQLVHLVAGPPNLVGVTWSPAVPMSGNVYPTTSIVYTVVGVDNNTCKGTATVSITVLPTPTITLSSSLDKICKGETSLITATGGNSYTLENTSQAYSSGSITVSPTITTNYTVTGDGSNGCLKSTVKTITVSACTGIKIETIEDEFGITLYPNPNNGEFLIVGQVPETIAIIDNSGRTIKQLNLNEANNYKVSITNLQAGIYFVLSSGGLGNFKQKIVVLK